ncbi:hypothetical protein [Psychrobacter pygoscelis]|uniref:hypothetical protein n=1 Tax=Psychrobacter pygoscelis TaxID=2488563 RepID=UPI00103F6852|nr:hypothetical protein [Psychrobacter pygoscelis]
MSKDELIQELLGAVEQIIVGLMCVGVILIVCAITGCHKPVLTQLDRDIATSTIEPLENFRAANKHANEFLAANRRDGDYE